MIDQGIVMLINAAGIPGGSMVELAKDQTLPAWTYLVVSQTSNRGLIFFRGLNTRRLQIDCYGNTGAEVIDLARRVDGVLEGFAGKLPDPDATFVSSCFNSDTQDFFDDAHRSYRRMLEYEINFSA